LYGILRTVFPVPDKLPDFFFLNIEPATERLILRKDESAVKNDKPNDSGDKIVKSGV